jgi:alkylation response protein AidB-like acyl-CoA dehydrogenase
MMFDFSPAQQAARDKARAFATDTVQACAATIDREALIPADVAGGAAALVGGDPLSTVLAIEELAAASPAVALSAAGARADGPPLRLAGLRGVASLDHSPRIQLALAAVALGIGKAAIAAALAELKQSRAVAGADVEKPHWVVSDAATEVEAARLLTYKAAHTNADADIALARLVATNASQRAVDAALRVTGTTGLQEGAALERLARDARAASLIMGTEEDQRATAADGLLPH